MSDEETVESTIYRLIAEAKTLREALERIVSKDWQIDYERSSEAAFDFQWIARDALLRAKGGES